MTTATERTPSIASRFISRLENLERGEKAILRRNAGLSIADSRGALGLFYRLLPMELAHQEEIYFLVSTLFPLNDIPAPEGNLGQAMAHLRSMSDSESLDRRMTILLDSDFERVRLNYIKPGELGFRLRQTVKLLASKDIGIHWETLLSDLLQWTHPDRWVQKKWARAYFSTLKADEEEGGDSNVS